MALLTATSALVTGVDITPQAVSESDTISRSDIGTNGALLQITNGSGSPITVTINDPGTTPASNPGTSASFAVAAAGNPFVRILPANVNPTTNVATVTFSDTTTVTYRLIRT